MAAHVETIKLEQFDRTLADVLDEIDFEAIADYQLGMMSGYQSSRPDVTEQSRYR